MTISPGAAAPVTRFCGFMRHHLVRGHRQDEIDRRAGHPRLDRRVRAEIEAHEAEHTGVVVVADGLAAPDGGSPIAVASASRPDEPAPGGVLACARAASTVQATPCMWATKAFDRPGEAVARLARGAERQRHRCGASLPFLERPPIRSQALPSSITSSSSARDLPSMETSGERGPLRFELPRSARDRHEQAVAALVGRGTFWGAERTARRRARCRGSRQPSSALRRIRCTICDRNSGGTAAPRERSPYWHPQSCGGDEPVAEAARKLPVLPRVRIGERRDLGGRNRQGGSRYRAPHEAPLRVEASWAVASGVRIRRAAFVRHREGALGRAGG